jgi:hypothetical protein
MTKSEAAKICQSIKFMMDKEDYSEEVEEALNMAIEALSENKRTDKRTETHACDCISRQDAIAEVSKHRNHGPKRYWNEYERGWNDAIDSVADHYLLDVPSAEPKRGKWVCKPDGYANRKSTYDMWRCDNCGLFFEEWEGEENKPTWNYCPNCGADMRGEGTI